MFVGFKGKSRGEERKLNSSIQVFKLGQVES